jgi:glutamate-5-semialdehyde dehydrogenase
MDIIQAGKKAREISPKLSTSSTELKNYALRKIADSLDSNREALIEANNIDLDRSIHQNLSKPLLKRLQFDSVKIDRVIEGIENLIKLSDPVGKHDFKIELDDNLILQRESCPIGVIGVIFESRPDALVQISTLGLKSGNAVLLKGGSEAIETNKMLTKLISDASVDAGIPEGWITLLETREDVKTILKLDEYIDLLIPRGSNEFVKYIMNNSNIPVLGHADGICHVYLDEEADETMAVEITADSKAQYVAVCNAAETLLVHQNQAEKILPKVAEKMRGLNVTLFGDDKTRSIIDCEPANEDSWKTEYLDYQMSVKVVNDFNEAVDHINRYGSGHTDCIVTSNKETADQFMQLVDSGNVFWNASTRFSDGFVYGFGAEVGISTNKIHARGPVGLEGLLIYKYKLYGNGHTRKDYISGKKKYTHKVLEI